MPAKSKAQLRYMAGVCSGNIRSPGLASEKACHFVRETKNAKKLPEKKKKKK